MPAYLKAAKQCGMTDAEMKLAVDTVSENPDAGDLIVSSGGLRKVRIAGRGKGKSGGYRIITYYAGKSDEPVFLVWVFSKGDAANLTDEQVKRLSDGMKAANTAAGKR